MNIQLIILGFAIFITVSVLSYFANKESNRRDETKACQDDGYIATEANVLQNTAEAASNELVLETRDLVIETLKLMGCKYEEREDNCLVFSYQGEKFMIGTINECLYINIFDLSWYELSTSCDLKEFSNMRKAINLVNQHASCNVFYAVNTENGKFVLHSRARIIFIRQIPYLKGYLESALDDFFRVQREVLLEMDKLQLQSDEKD